MYAGKFCCSVSLYWNCDCGGWVYAPYENRTTSLMPTVYVPPKRGWNSPYETVAPFAVELVRVACASVPAGMDDVVTAEHGVPGAAPSSVSSIGLPPLTAGLKHITLFQALNQNARGGR